MSRLPEELRDDMARAKRLEWWTLAWMATVVVAMAFTMGASQAMRSALFEDVLSLVPAIVFLIAAKLETKDPTERFPHGFVRVNSLAFLAAAVVLTMVGGFLLYESVTTLLAGEHPTVGPMAVFGHTVWLGWLMIAALVYSVIPPLILGRMKKPVAERLRDKVLYTDALMQKADWQTGLAGVAGIGGIALGYWWADSAAAAFISLSILHDGINSIRTASAELLDGAPRRLEGQGISDDGRHIAGQLRDRWPDARVRLRESGRYVIADVDGVSSPDRLPELGDLAPDEVPWRLTRLVFSPPAHGDDAAADSGEKD